MADSVSQGMDDSERILKAVMTLIHPEEPEFPKSR